MAEFYNENVNMLVGTWLRKRRHKMGEEEWEAITTKMRNSSLLYVGNLSFYTTEEQIYHFFSSIAPLQRVIMGLNRETKTPCGFCFVEYFTHQDACNAVYFLNGLRLDNRYIHVDLDYEFQEGRQYGRGQSGGQRRDDVRRQFKFKIDPDRGDDNEMLGQEQSAEDGSAKRQKTEH